MEVKVLNGVHLICLENVVVLCATTMIVKSHGMKEFHAQCGAKYMALNNLGVKKNKNHMTKNEIEVGKKVWYYPILGDSEKKAAVIESGPYEMCGTTCCMIDIISSVVDIENLEVRND